METLLELRDEEFPQDTSGVETRVAARVVLVDDAGRVPLLFVSKHNYHKLPGGGVDDGEDLMTALVREVREETGCEIEVLGELGKIIEYRSKGKFDWKFDLEQTSYCYYGRVVSVGTPEFTDSEKEDGFQLVWVSLLDAIPLFQEGTPDNAEGMFISQRDLTFLKRAALIMKHY